MQGCSWARVVQDSILVTFRVLGFHPGASFKGSDVKHWWHNIKGRRSVSTLKYKIFSRVWVTIDGVWFGNFLGYFLIVCWQIPSGALVYHPQQRAFSIGPSNFCMWGCGQRCLFILGAVWSLLPPQWAGYQPAAATAAIARTCLMSVHAWTLWQWVHSAWHGRREWAPAVLCFRLDSALKRTCTLAGAESARRVDPRGSENSWVRLIQSGWCAGGTLARRGTCGNVLVSSQFK
jgi:hypothetical protein